jgi:hypothetical protein
VGREGEARLSGHRSISKSILTSRNATTRQVVNKLEDSSMLYLSALKLNLEHFRHIQAVDLMQDLQSRKHELRRTDLSIFCNICGPSLILVYLLTKCRYIFIPLTICNYQSKGPDILFSWFQMSHVLLITPHRDMVTEPDTHLISAGRSARTFFSIRHDTDSSYSLAATFHPAVRLTHVFNPPP